MTPRSLLRALLTTGLATAMVAPLALPAQAAESSSYQPVQFQGEPLSPGSNQDNAPVLEPDAHYTGSFGTETQYYRIARTSDDSTLHVGIASHHPDSGFSRAEIELLTLGDSSSCDSDRLEWSNNQADGRFTTAQIRATPPLDPEHHSAVPGCGSDDELLLSISPDSELSDQDFELIIAEESEPTNAGELRSSFESDPRPWDAEAPEWFDMPRDRDASASISEDSSFHDAPLLEAGSTYDAEIRPGQVQIFRLPADWNEQIQAEVFFPEPDSVLGENLSSWTNASVRILNPYYGDTEPGSGQLADRTGRTSDRIHDSNATTLHTHSYPVHWSGRYGTFTGANARNSSVAGEYYVAVSVEPQDDAEPFNIPYRLTTDTFSVFDEDPPAYPGGEVAWGTGEAEETAAETDEDGERAASERTSGFGAAQVMLIVLGSFGLLLVAAGGLFLARTIRAGRSEER